MKSLLCFWGFFLSGAPACLFSSSPDRLYFHLFPATPAEHEIADHGQAGFGKQNGNKHAPRPLPHHYGKEVGQGYLEGPETEDADDGWRTRVTGPIERIHEDHPDAIEDISKGNDVQCAYGNALHLGGPC